jgi:hypothetical protein
MVVRIIQEDNPRLWLWVGVIAGFGLLNRHSMLFFGLGLLIGMVMSPLRKHFKSPWFYAGGGIALLMILPNLIWQMTHDWPTLNFVLNLNEGVMSGISPPQFLAGQLLYPHPFNIILWLWGLLFLLFSRTGKPYRPPIGKMRSSGLPTMGSPARLICWDRSISCPLPPASA